MKDKLIIIAAFAFLVFIWWAVLTGHVPHKFPGDRPIAPPPAEQTKTKEQIEKEKLLYVMGKTVACESGGRLNVWGDGGLACSISQFHHATFEFMKKKSGMKDLRWCNGGDQIKLMEWSFENGWANQWTCWKDHHKEWEEEYENQSG